MHVRPLLPSDLEQLPGLQPEGWGDIGSSFNFYLSHSFCFPVGLWVGQQLVGVGSCVVHRTTAWLCHIIVHSEFRNRGLGTLITDDLITIAKQNPQVETLLLLATKLGAPVYQKSGFEIESDYVFYKGGTFNVGHDESIVPCATENFSEVLQLDREISGEDREQLLMLHRDRCVIKKVDGKVDGVYFPALGDGLIIAKTTSTGEDLMKFRSTTESRFVIPEQNIVARDLLLKNGYEPFLRGTRMRMGKKIDWYPEGLYNRIGGNLG